MPKKKTKILRYKAVKKFDAVRMYSILSRARAYALAGAQEREKA